MLQNLQTMLLPLSQLFEGLRDSISARRGRPIVGVWSVSAEFVQQALEFAASTDANEPIAPVVQYVAQDGGGGGKIAVIPITGVMMKRRNTYPAQQALEAAAKDPDVSAIALRIESPGGSVSGTPELGDAVLRARAIKPVHAYAEELCCSAAYWVGSQAETISANRTAIVGSIGAYFVVTDWSGFFDKFGLKVHVISTGPLKGAGVGGAPITDEHLEHWQHLVHELNREFLAAVTTGRRKTDEDMAALATGAVWTAREALTHGLIDRVESWDDFVGRLADGHKVEKRKGNKMSDQNTGTTGTTGDHIAAVAAPLIAATSQIVPAATLAQLKEGLPGVSSDFLLAQIEKGATLVDAQRDYIAHCNAERSVAAAVNTAGAVVAAATNQSAPRGNRATGALAAAATGNSTQVMDATQRSTLIATRAREIQAAHPDARPIVCRAQALKQLKAEYPNMFGSA